MNTIASLRALYLASALYAAAAVGQPAANDDLIALATVAAFHQALTAGNAEAALRLLAPDAVIMEDGELETRRQYQERHLAADIQFARSVKTVRSGMSAAVSGEVAWVTSTSVTEGSYKGRRIALNGAELMVLSKAPTGWLIRAIHWSSHKRK